MVRTGLSYYNEKQLKRIRQQSKMYSCYIGLTVLDIGCNSGYATNKIADYAEKVLAVDKIQGTVKNPKITYYKKELKDFLQEGHDFNAINAFNVLYYLTDEELWMLEKSFPKCKIIMMGSSEKKNDLGKFNKRNLHKWENIDSWLKSNGLKTKQYFKDTDWVTIIAQN